MSKRMFSDSIVESDSFLDMPLTSQSLYFHLCMNADNDGFVNPRRIMRMCGAANDDLQVLIAKRFLICFDSGVVVIKHWWINNTKRSDRHIPTTYQFELASLYIKSNKSYTQNTTEMAIPTEIDNQLQLDWQPNGSARLPQSSLKQFNAKQYNPVLNSKPGELSTAAKTGTTGLKNSGNKFLEVNVLYEDLADLVNDKYKGWYCKTFFSLGRERIQRMASEARADAATDKRKLFSHMLKEAVKATATA